MNYIQLLYYACLHATRFVKTANKLNFSDVDILFRVPLNLFNCLAVEVVFSQEFQPFHSDSNLMKSEMTTDLIRSIRKTRSLVVRWYLSHVAEKNKSLTLRPGHESSKLRNKSSFT